MQLCIEYEWDVIRNWNIIEYLTVNRMYNYVNLNGKKECKCGKYGSECASEL